MGFTNNLALRQLSGDHGKLLNAISNAHSLGLHCLHDPPMLVVCGKISSGKSSVLKAISRIPFPSHDESNRCTQFATEITLRRSDSPSTKVSIIPGPSCTDPSERARLRNYMHDGVPAGYTFPDIMNVTELEVGLLEVERFDDVTDHVLKFEVCGPDLPECTVVDLPGLDIPTTEHDDDQSARVAKQLAERYMASTRSIVLLVVSAEHCDHMDELLEMVRQFDRKGERTLGIVTRPDTLQSGSEGEDSVLQLLRNERINLPLGWHVLRNHYPDEPAISDNARDQQERAFFNEGSWRTLLPDCVGAESLRRRLSGILFDHHQRHLPTLVGAIQKRMSDNQARLSKLGNSRTTAESQRAYLLDIATDFERIMNHAVDETYIDGFFDGLGRRLLIRRTIRQLNEFFADAMAIRGAQRIISDGPPSVPFTINPYLQGWSPQGVTRTVLEKEARELMRNYGSEAAGNAKRIVAGMLFREQAQPWEELARMHLLRAWDAIKHFVFTALKHLTDERISIILARSVVEPALERLKQDVLQKLTELSLPTKRYVALPMSKAETARVEEARKARLLQSLETTLAAENLRNPGLFYLASIKEAVLHVDAARDEHAAAEIVDHMQFHYETAVTTFIDNVNSLAVENCLVNPLRGIFTSQVVNSMSESQIQELAADPPKVIEERSRLRTELDEFRAAIRALDVFRPLELSFENLSVDSKPDVPESPSPQETSTSSLNVSPRSHSGCSSIASRYTPPILLTVY
ncbi:hypothetical protein ASPVEDRAFT_137873 [Aspergillus versicolor CBS 583.65]|uniref:GED domain-containing protein n=1 Tax=Aspergillus versicolor CBS 583.65 TaxID=1036611 RepID=A0A1L9PW74_ASPVE|nr:uncharacterized protein ASPVEDRAFT_137873 [Aspergillus versicolor CBS 583.65]OJJ05778.1 hypothetical protein ASPVEDRAFT_137873 [Aspergillus versicolor CBS 583.65]